MDELEIGVALIRKVDQRIQWLGKKNPTQQQIDFVIADRLEKESWREAIMREVAWELDLDGKRDMVVSNMAQLNLEFESVLPCLLYTSPSPRDATLSRMPSSA